MKNELVACPGLPSSRRYCYWKIVESVKSQKGKKDNVYNDAHGWQPLVGSIIELIHIKATQLDMFFENRIAVKHSLIFKFKFPPLSQIVLIHLGLSSGCLCPRLVNTVKEE